MNACAASRRLCTLAAVLLLLFQSVLPSVHRWQHALERADQRPGVASHHHGGGPVGAVQDDDADVCALCLELLQVRDLLPELTVPPALASASPRALPPPVGHRWLALPLPLPPPARGPPVS